MAKAIFLMLIAFWISNPDNMKRTPALLLAFCCLLFSANSCTVSKNAVEQKTDFISAKEHNSICFVQLNDGSIKYYASLKLVTGILTTPFLLADNNIKITAQEIKAYQDFERYAITQSQFIAGKTSRVAVDCLPGFATRIAKGKLNIYCRKYYNGQRTVEEFFLQNGDGEKILPYSAELMQAYVKDNPAALEFFNSKKIKQPAAKKLILTAGIFNQQQQLITKN